MKWQATAAMAAAALMLAAPASAITTVFTATLTGAAEAIPVATSAMGLGIVTFDDSLLTVKVEEIFINLSAPASAAHIHCCTAVAGVSTSGVALGFTSFPAAVSASYVNTFTLSAASFASLLTGSLAGKAYLNIHNANYPGGEIRGFLAATTPVPEPGTLTLWLSGLSVAGVLAVRRRRAG